MVGHGRRSVGHYTWSPFKECPGPPAGLIRPCLSSNLTLINIFFISDGIAFSFGRDCLGR